MPAFLNRTEAPLSDADWERIDRTIVEVARRQLVGRRIIDVFGPLGPGVQDVDYDVFTGIGEAVVSMLGEEESSLVRVSRRIHQNIPLVYKDFNLYWRDIEKARKLDMPLDVSPAAAAASFVAQQEDRLIFYGEKDFTEGLMNATGRQTLGARNWEEAGNAFQDVVDARTKLLDGGFYGPYALVVNPNWFSAMHRVYANSGVLEINHVRDIATAGVYQSPVLEKNHALLVSVGVQNFDIAVAQDLSVAFLGPERMNYPFRVFESLSLRLKRPGAICTLEGRSGGRK